MANGINRISFTGNNSSLSQQNSAKSILITPNNLLRQPAKDEVAFTGLVVKTKDLLNGLKRLGFIITNNNGRHGVHIEGLHKTTKTRVNVPVSIHGKEIGANMLAKLARQLGFKNAKDLATVVS